jgi:2-octaprenyl-6-methoxyphenol hydroxylase
MKEYDVCIIGSGFCGSVLANSLNFLGVNTVVLEKNSKENFLKTDNRNLVLSYGSGLILKNLGYSFGKHYNLEKIEYSLKGSFGSFVINAKQYNVPFLGKVVNAGEWLTNSYYQNCLFDSVVDNLELCIGKSKVDFSHQGVKKSIYAKIIVGADGVNSLVRSYLGDNKKDVLRGYHAYIIPVVEMLDRFAWLRSDKDKSLAYIPSSNSEGVLILTTMLDLKQDQLAAICKNLAGHRLKKSSILAATSFRHSFSSFLSEINNLNAVCIGNALHALPPVAAQGFNLGIRDCAVLIELLGLALIKKDFSINEVAQRFYQARKEDITSTYNLSKRALTVGSKGLTFLPSLAFGCLNSGLDFVLRDNIYKLLGLVKPYNIFLEQDIFTFKKEISNDR